MNSTHSAFVVPVKLENHPNADSLSVVKFDGFTVCVRTEDWEGVDKGIHIQPDSMVDTSRSEFAFLKPAKQKYDQDGKPTSFVRITVRKMRGIVSYGFLLPLYNIDKTQFPNAEQSEIGEDWAERLGIKHYEPIVLYNTRNQNNVPAPPGIFTKYDIDNIRKYNNVFSEGELIYCSEKTNGANGRFVFSSEKNQMYVGSRNLWKKEEEYCMWWRAFRKYLELEAFCRDNPDWLIYGEVFGNVGGFRYGKKDVDFVAFDIRKPDLTWCDPEEFRSLCKQYNIPMVPIILWNAPFCFEDIIEHSNGPSLIVGADHYREGCVVKPMKERWDEKIGRVILKCVGTDYLAGKKKR